MIYSTLTFVTDFADQAVILPLLGTVALALMLQRRWRVLAAWLVAVGAVLGAILILKVACYSCGWLIPALDPASADLRSPSGHTAAAAVTYASVAALQFGGLKSATVWVAFVVAASTAAAIGLTRLALGVHSLAEVEVAALIGTIGAVAFVALAGRELSARPGTPVVLAAVVVVALMHGAHLPAEAAIQVRGVEFVRRLVQFCDPGLRRPATPAAAAWRAKGDPMSGTGAEARIDLGEARWSLASEAGR